MIEETDRASTAFSEDFDSSSDDSDLDEVDHVRESLQRQRSGFSAVLSDYIDDADDGSAFQAVAKTRGKKLTPLVSPKRITSSEAMQGGRVHITETKPPQDTKKEEEPANRMAEGAKVYVRDPHYSWIPATIESPEDDKMRVKVAVRLPKDWDSHTVVATGRGANNMKMDRLVKLSEYPNNELPLQNLDKEGTVSGKNDMADLANLHEASILFNLKSRHSNGCPYTRVGDIMVAVNPFDWIDGLYSPEKQEFYARNLIWQASLDSNDLIRPRSPEKGRPALLATAATERKAVGYDFEKLGINPHVYETSSLAYLGLAVEGNDQTILVTGESGAGKTETIKIVMDHLATVERSRPSWPESDRVQAANYHASDTVERVLKSNPMFEAFGNAKTTRNDNSSRFGKYTQLQFDVEDRDAAIKNGRRVPSCHLSGSKCITYLLEKSRVVSISQGEGTFHVFYQLLGAPDSDKMKIWDGLCGKSVADFAYMSSTTPEDIGGLAGPDHWPETVAALSVFGVEGDTFLDVMRSLCVILQLGNIVFDRETHDGEERAVISSTEELKKLSLLMGVPEADIADALTKRFMNTRGEEFTIFLKPNEARDGCDALSKEIYARVFDFLVSKCNGATEPQDSGSKGYGTISLLDIFGFESFKVNRFEQLCINFANERLQQKFVIDNFYAIKHEYEAEGIDIFDLSLVDNTDVMDLLEGKLGLITQLNEESVKKMAGGDESFVYKFKVVNSDSNRLIQDPLHRPYEFGVRHYAAPIKYDARRFIERNLDRIPADLLKCACQSNNNSLIREEFQKLSSGSETLEAGGLKKRSAATKHLVITKFRQQLTSLMSLIELSRTRYIRCVKPNKISAPRTMDQHHTASQLESAGLLTAIVISRESFPNRLSYELIMERFKFLAFKFDCELNSGDIKLDSSKLLGLLLKGLTADSHLGRVSPFQCGKTKVYFRAGALEIIETTRQEYYAERALQLQTWVRSRLERRRFIALKRGAIQIQSLGRRRIALISFRQIVRCAVKAQCFVRRCLACAELSRLRANHAATVIQTCWRGVKPRAVFGSTRRASVQIQCLVRIIISRKICAAKKKERAEQAAIESRMSMMQQTLDDATTVAGGGTLFSVDEGLLDEVETMFEYLRKEIGEEIQLMHQTRFSIDLIKFTVILRKKNARLKKELQEAEADKREIFNHASSVDHAFALSKIRNEQMTKTNSTLLADNNKRKKEVNKLKAELRTQQEAHEAQLQEMKTEFDLALQRREMEFSSIEQSAQSVEAMHNREVQMIRDEAERKQEEHFAQISRLRDEIKTTQQSHQDYLSKLMGVLDTTQESRKSSLTPAEEMTIRAKNAEILELKDEIARLQQQNGMSDNAAREDSKKKEAVKSMKYIVKKNREARKGRSKELQLLTSQLNKSIMSGDDATSQQLLASINQLAHVGEKSNSKMDREMVNMIDNTVSYFNRDNHKASADQALIEENKKLRRKLVKMRQRSKGDQESASIIG